MPLSNPYGKLSEADSVMLNSLVSAEDKHLLQAFGGRGVIQKVVNTLLYNLINELRSLNSTTYRPDADDILGILCEKRPITIEQQDRLAGTSLGRDAVDRLIGRGLVYVGRPGTGKAKSGTTPTTPRKPTITKGGTGSRRRINHPSPGAKGQDSGGETKSSVGKTNG